MVKTVMAAALDDHPDDLKRKLDLLEGDRKAFYESSQEAMKRNQESITQFRRENKALALKLRELKAPKANRGPSDVNKAIEKMDLQVCAQIKKHNSLRAEANRKQQKLQQLERKLATLDMQEQNAEKAAAGAESNEQLLRQLENRLDKANIKCQEAQHIGKTYNAIIDKLNKDRLTFDTKIAKMERNIQSRKAELENLEAMCNDAVLARDAARRELAEREAENNAARQAREAEKRELDQLAEERRRQYENTEKRLRQVTHGDRKENTGEEVSEETKKKIVTYEDAMQRIKDVTGVTDVQEVVQRFLTQGSTQEHLNKLQQENEETLASLRAEHDKVTKEFEALKYSGEARNTGNQRMLTDFEQRLTTAEQKRASVKALEAKLSKVLVDVKGGIDHLHDKLEKLKPVQFRAASNVKDKLTESELRLVNLVEEIDQRKGEAVDLPTAPPMLLPEHNTRIRIPTSADDQGAESDSDDDDEVISRDVFKQHVQTVVDSKTKKGGGGANARRKKRK